MGSQRALYAPRTTATIALYIKKDKDYYMWVIIVGCTESYIRVVILEGHPFCVTERPPGDKLLDPGRSKHRGLGRRRLSRPWTSPVHQGNHIYGHQLLVPI